MGEAMCVRGWCCHHDARQADPLVLDVVVACSGDNFISLDPTLLLQWPSCKERPQYNRVGYHEF
jgi:hypothetical protein